MCGSSLAARQPVLPACAENEGFPTHSPVHPYSRLSSQKKEKSKGGQATPEEGCCYLSVMGGLPRLLVLALFAACAHAWTPALPALARLGAPNAVTRAPVASAPAMQFAIPGTEKRSGGSAVLDKPDVLKSPEVEDKVGKDKMYHVLLFNDPVNTREYVAKTLKEIFGHSKSKAYDIMNHAHTTGFAVCITTSKSEADDG